MYKYRSLLFVPARRERLVNIEKFDADAYIIDLEDSIRENEKEQALEQTLSYLKEWEDKDDRHIFVRLNADRSFYEMEYLKDCGLKGFMIPKFESVNELHAHQDLVAQKEIIALVETPMGLVNIKEIASDKLVSAVAFGAEDYAAIIGMKKDHDTLLYPKSVIVTYAAAYEKPAFDTVFANISKEEEFMEQVKESYKMGFVGKMLIHPKQIQPVHDIFMKHDLSFYQKIINLFETNSNGVLELNGQIFERPHIERFKKILETEMDETGK